jgi:hypothetical protein
MLEVREEEKRGNYAKVYKKVGEVCEGRQHNITKERREKRKYRTDEVKE